MQICYFSTDMHAIWMNNTTHIGIEFERQHKCFYSTQMFLFETGPSNTIIITSIFEQ